VEFYKATHKVAAWVLHKEIPTFARPGGIPDWTEFLSSLCSRESYGDVDEPKPFDPRYVELQILQKDFNQARKMHLEKPYLPLYKDSGINPTSSFGSVHVESPASVVAIPGKVFDLVPKEALQPILCKQEAVSYT
jgi:hypothetical protein